MFSEWGKNGSGGLGDHDFYILNTALFYVMLPIGCQDSLTRIMFREMGEQDQNQNHCAVSVQYVPRLCPYDMCER